MSYTEKQYNNTTLHYYKWNDSDGEPPSPYQLMIDWQDRYSIEDLSRLSCNEKLRGKKASLVYPQKLYNK